MASKPASSDKTQSKVSDMGGKKLLEFAEQGNVKELKQLVNSTNVNAKYAGMTLLMKAAEAPDNRGLKCVEYLLQIKADVKATTVFELNAMHYASENNDLIIELLHKHDPSLINSKTFENITPLMMAAGHDCIKAVKMLIKLNANLIDTDFKGRTAADHASEWTTSSESYWAIVDAVNGTKTVNEKEKMKRIKQREDAIKLCNLAGQGKVEELKKLVTSVNVNSRLESATPLMHAAGAEKNSGQSCVALLLKMGADAELRNFEGYTAAHYAADNGNDLVLNLLPESTFNLQEDNGWTPLMQASFGGHKKAAGVLIAKGADTKITNYNEDSATDIAKRQHNDDVMKLVEMAEKLAISDHAKKQKRPQLSRSSTR